MRKIAPRWAFSRMLMRNEGFILPPDTDDGGRYAVVSVTQTGTEPLSSEVLRAVILDQDGRQLLDMYFKPVWATQWPEAEALTGIGPRDVGDCGSLVRNAATITATLRDYRRIVGYDVYFHLAGLFLRGVKWEAAVTDVMEEAGRMLSLCGESPADGCPSLKQCAEHFGDADYTPHHDACEDALETLECYRAMRGYRSGASPYYVRKTA